MSKNKYLGQVISVVVLSFLLAYQLVFATDVGTIIVNTQNGVVNEGIASTTMFTIKVVSHGNNPSTCESNQAQNDNNSENPNPTTVNLTLAFASTTLPVTGVFDPVSPISISGSFNCTSLTLSVPANVPAGSYAFTVTGSGENSGNLNNAVGNGTLLVGAPVVVVPTFTPVVISGRVYDDINGNGSDESGYQCGEEEECNIQIDPSLEGWTVSAFPVITSETDTRATTTVVSTSTGYYFSFGPNDVGQWIIVETLPSGWFRTQPSDNGYTFNVSTSSESSSARSFGNYKIPVLQVFKFNDLNKNGLKDEGESGIANWPFVLAREDEGNENERFFRIATATTNVEGIANFEVGQKHMGAFVFEGIMSGWTRSYPASTNPFGTSTITFDKLPFSDGTQVDTNVFYRLCEFNISSRSVVSVGSTSTSPCGTLTSIVFGNYTNNTTPVEQPTFSGGGVVFNPNQTVNFNAGTGTTGGTVLGASTSCGLYMSLNTAMGINLKNDKTQVFLLQKFLNSHMNAGLEENGIYNLATKQAVEKFQLKYSDDILKPWGLSKPSGVVYYTTILKINNLVCPDLGLKLEKERLVPMSKKRG